MVHVYPTLVDGLGHEAAEAAIRRAVDFMMCVTSHRGEYHPAESCLAGSQHLHDCGASTPRGCPSRRQLALPDGLLSLSVRGGAWSPERALRVVQSPGSARRGLAGVLDSPSDRVSTASPSLSDASSVLRGEILVVEKGAPIVPGVPMMQLWQGTKMLLPTTPLLAEVACIEEEDDDAVPWEADQTVLQLML